MNTASGFSCSFGSQADIEAGTARQRKGYREIIT